MSSKKKSKSKNKKKEDLQTTENSQEGEESVGQYGTFDRRKLNKI